jgi:hypothetical protein
MHHALTKMLEPISSASQMKRFQDWGICSHAKIAKRWVADLASMIGADTSALPGVLFSLCCADNTGTLVQGAIQALRKEITSVYFKDICAFDMKRSLNLSVDEWMGFSSEWVPMHLTGYEKADDVLAGKEDDAYVCFLRQSFIRAVDDITALNYLDILASRDTADDYDDVGQAVDGRTGE